MLTGVLLEPRRLTRYLHPPPNVETMCGMCNSIFSDRSKAEAEAVAHIQRVAAHMEADRYA
jgi:hypothetical protein